ncbi:PREDICTED: vesicle-associated protein 4-3 [Camelina sativa]|uniref:Vesicle-associated protein 4-3 n=1 Tax=Camelina sativa TaxID=90675 RepID=A0ABM0VGK7_CAMSA|nr:PREDICTED: vesicle-associated protein 4-3 [Camelina sativa]
MALTEEKSDSDGRRWGKFKLPFRNSNNAQATSSSMTTPSSSHLNQNYIHQTRHFQYHGPPVVEGLGQQNHHQSAAATIPSMSSVARSLLPTKRRLKLDPSAKLYFPYEPGKQVRSAIKIKNTSKSHVAFKFQTTEPKSCFMRPAGAILAPGEEIIATVFKFVEPPENSERPVEQKSGVKFKIMSLKMKVPTDYMPELFEEQKEHVSEEQVMRVVFLDPESSNPMMEKLKSQLAEADAVDEARKKASEGVVGPKPIGEGLVIDEWKQRRERYLAQQQGGDMA